MRQIEDDYETDITEEAGLQINIRLSDASCNNTGVTKKIPKSILGKGRKAVSKKLLQLHIKSNFIPLKAGDITHIDKDEDLELLMFIKEKRDGGFKG